MTQDLEDIRTLKARLDHTDQMLREMRLDLKKLVEAEAERRGRENVKSKNEDYAHDDRIQVWVRALIPVSLITLVINGVIAFFWGK